MGGEWDFETVFPRLFSLSLSKAYVVAAFGGWNNGMWVWNFVWRRNLFEWEKQIAGLVSQEVQGVSFDLGIQLNQHTSV